jgi:hypothetical protein
VIDYSEMQDAKVVPGGAGWCAGAGTLQIRSSG